MALNPRYSRNTLLNEIQKEGQERLNAAKVLIAGVGGLGSSVAYNLACLGVHNLGLLDYDRVEASNLNRQILHNEPSLGLKKTTSAKQTLQNFNSNIEIVEHNLIYEEKNGKELLKNYDIIMDCFDNFQSKFLLNKHCVELNKPLIHAGVEKLSGQVMSILPNKTACLSCLLEEKINMEVDKAIISPIINIIGSIASYEATKFILGKEDELSTNQILIYDLKTNTIRKVRVSKNPNCRVCGEKN